ncbi:MAG TPA: dihydropteroate synthase [Acidimicrobiales bacterium]|nr:dihydropteroate synthase [Acidimicrobiales bacterium]
MSLLPVSSRALVMGVLNVTPDSFSDAGRWLEPADAITRGIAMVSEGADVVDIGGESTRPGAAAVPPDEQLRRVIPVVEALAEHVRVSIDTRSAKVAAAAVAAGATLINDVSACLGQVAADHGVGWVAMHMLGDPLTMQDDPRYADVVSEVAAFLDARAAEAEAAGVSEVWIDPGIGFGKTLEHNLALLRGIGALVELGRPVLVGTSRKGLLGSLTARNGIVPPPEDRVEASVASAVWAVLRGARMVRVHDVAPTVNAIRLMEAPAAEDFEPPLTVEEAVA